MIEIQGLSKTYHALLALDNLSISVQPGESVALIGPNGSGKTTLIKCILGLASYSQGDIRVNGINIASNSQYRNNIGYMPQLSRFPENMSVNHLFQMVQSLRSDIPSNEYDWELYNLFDIEGMACKKLSALSGGMKQKVSAALAFLFSPDILILDEPTAALDPVANDMLKCKISASTNAGKTIIISSHILTEVQEMTNMVAFMMDGRLIFYQSYSDLALQTDEISLQKSIVKILQERSRHA